MGGGRGRQDIGPQTEPGRLDRSSQQVLVRGRGHHVLRTLYARIHARKFLRLMYVQGAKRVRTLNVRLTLLSMQRTFNVKLSTHVVKSLENVV